MKAWLAGLLALLVSTTANAEQPAGQQRVLAVIYEITLDPQGKPTAVTPVRVIDPASGSQDAVDIPVPEPVLARARDKWMKEAYEPGPASVFSYEFFSPAAD